jgi:hypothetical protein
MLFFDKNTPILLKEDKSIQISDFKDTIVRGDHNSTVIQFKLDRYLENYIDLLEMLESKYTHDIIISFKNAYGNYYDYYCEREEEIIDSAPTGKIIISWIISQNVTEAAGKVSFVIRVLKTEEFEQEDGEGNVQTYRKYKKWQSLPGTLIVKDNDFYSDGSYDLDAEDTNIILQNKIVEMQETISNLQNQIEKMQREISSHSYSITTQRSMLDDLRVDVDALKSQINL